MILILIFILNFIHCEELSLGILYQKPTSDLFGSGDLTLISLEKEKASIDTSFLGSILNHSVSFSFWPDYYGKGYYGFLSGTYKIDQNQAFNILYYSYSSGSEEINYLDGRTENIVYEKNNIVSAGFGTKLNDNLNLGIRIKNMTSTLAERYESSGFAFDFDILFKIDEFYIYGGVENINGYLKYENEKEELPLFYKSEIAYFFKNKKYEIGIGFGGKYTTETKTYSAGICFSPLNLPVFLNAAYTKDWKNDFFSSGINIRFENIILGYSMRFPQIFDTPMFRITISYIFNNEKKEKQKTPSYKSKKEPPKKLQPQKIEKEEQKEKTKSKPVPSKSNNIIVF